MNILISSKRNSPFVTGGKIVIPGVHTYEFDNDEEAAKIHLDDIVKEGIKTGTITIKSEVTASDVGAIAATGSAKELSALVTKTKEAIDKKNMALLSAKKEETISKLNEELSGLKETLAKAEKALTDRLDEVEKKRQKDSEETDK